MRNILFFLAVTLTLLPASSYSQYNHDLPQLVCQSVENVIKEHLRPPLAAGEDSADCVLIKDRFLNAILSDTTIAFPRFAFFKDSLYTKRQLRKEGIPGYRVCYPYLHADTLRIAVVATRFTVKGKSYRTRYNYVYGEAAISTFLWCPNERLWKQIDVRKRPFTEISDLFSFTQGFY